MVQGKFEHQQSIDETGIWGNSISLKKGIMRSKRPNRCYFFAGIYASAPGSTETLETKSVGAASEACRFLRCKSLSVRLRQPPVSSIARLADVFFIGLKAEQKM